MWSLLPMISALLVRMRKTGGDPGFKENADSRHLMHLNVGDDFYYGLMLKQRDYYIYAYIPERTVFHTLPQNVIMVMFIYMVVVTLVWLLLKNPGQTALK